MSTTAAADEGAARPGRVVGRGDTLPAGWRDILWRTYSEVNRDHVLLVAAGRDILHPSSRWCRSLTVMVSIYGLVADPATLDRHMDLLEGPYSGCGLELCASSFNV